MDNYRRETKVKAATGQKTKSNQQTAETIARIRHKFTLLDYPMLLVMALLILMGYVMIFSSTMYLGENPMSFFLKQFAATGLGIVAFMIGISVKSKVLENIKFLNIAMLGLVIALFVLMIIGEIGGGAQSWVFIGAASFQPSELLKFVSVLVVSRLLAYQQREVILSKEEISKKTIFISILLIITAVFLVLEQPDLGMAAIIVGTMLIVTVQQTYNRKINLLMYTSFAGIVLLMNLLSRLASDWLISNQGYRFSRLGSYTNPFLYSQDDGYQLISAYLAFSRGGWFGVGLGQGVTKKQSLPAGHTDFILANIGEEAGLLGVIVVISLLFALIFMIYRWAAQSTSHFRRNVLFGVATSLLIQSFINIGGIAGLIPLTGVTLPFISYGGSSMIVSIVTVAVAQVMIIEEKLQMQLRLDEAYQQELAAIGNIEKKRTGLTLVHSRKQEK